LYLLGVSRGMRAAGAYYFPASVEYREKEDGVFRLQGFMDGSDEVVTASDKSVQPKQKSSYVEAYLAGRKVDGTMTKEEFSCFLDYSRLITNAGIKEFLAGNITPSPAEGTCKFCKAGGSCGFAVGKDGEERTSPAVRCTDIAGLVKRIKEGGNG